MRTLYLREHGGQRQATTIVHDEFNNACYLLTGKWGLRQDVLSLYTMQGSLLAEVKQVTLGLWPKFVLYQNRQRVGVIAKSLGFVRQVIYIRGLNWMVVGSPSLTVTGSIKGTGWSFQLVPLKTPGALPSSSHCRPRRRTPRHFSGHHPKPLGPPSRSRTSGYLAPPQGR
ncbi:hypothetical protein QPX96_08190 [Limosilactobacillus fermentum]|nr:hypothetical protein [Limosilactobacillus fermentum]